MRRKGDVGFIFIKARKTDFYHYNFSLIFEEPAGANANTQYKVGASYYFEFSVVTKRRNLPCSAMSKEIHSMIIPDIMDRQMYFFTMQALQ